MADRGHPFDDPDFLYEVKFDGFRALAYVEDGHCELVSRKGHVYRRFAELCQSTFGLVTRRSARWERPSRRLADLASSREPSIPSECAPALLLAVRVSRVVRPLVRAVPGSAPLAGIRAIRVAGPALAALPPLLAFRSLALLSLLPLLAIVAGERIPRHRRGAGPTRAGGRGSGKSWRDCPTRSGCRGYGGGRRAGVTDDLVRHAEDLLRDQDLSRSPAAISMTECGKKEEQAHACQDRAKSE